MDKYEKRLVHDCRLEFSSCSNEKDVIGIFQRSRGYSICH